MMMWGNQDVMKDRDQATVIVPVDAGDSCCVVRVSLIQPLCVTVALGGL